MQEDKNKDVIKASEIKPPQITDPINDSINQLDQITDLLSNINEVLNRILFGKIEKIADEEVKDTDSISKGKIQILKYGAYYDISNTITNAQATDPLDFDNINYNSEKVHDQLERNAQQITVINDEAAGGATLFVVASHSGGIKGSHETPIYPKETKTFYNIHELKLRSAVQGAKYRVTEYSVKSLL